MRSLIQTDQILKKYAVIVIDMLNDFVTGPIASPRVHHIIQPIKELCDKARAQGIPVIYANDSHTPEIDKEFKIWGPHAVEGTPGAEVIDELKPQKGDYIVPKKTYSGFYETTMELLLRELFGFLLKHSTGHYTKGSEVDVPLTYADYYFLEALYRYKTLKSSVSCLRKKV